MSTTITLPVGALPGGGGGSGIKSINGDTTSAQVIAAGTGISVSSSSGTTTITNTSSGGSPASPPTSVQFNNSGSFGGDSNLVWDNTNKFLGIGAAANDPLGIRDGANNNFAVSGPVSVSGNGVTIHSYNDAKSANEALEIRATKTVFDVGPVGIFVDPPTAYLHIAPTGGFAAFKINSGTVLGTPEDGALEYDGTHLYFDIGTSRFQLDQQGTSAAAAAPDTSIQFNTAGLLDGSANLVWNGSYVEIQNIAATNAAGQVVLKLDAGLDATVGSGPKILFSNQGTADVAAIRGYSEASFQSGLIFSTGYGSLVDQLFLHNNGDLTLVNGGIDIANLIKLAGSSGTSGQAIVSQGASPPIWGAPIAAAAGSSGQIQYNNASALAGDTGFTTDGAGNLTAASVSSTSMTVSTLFTSISPFGGGPGGAGSGSVGDRVLLYDATTTNRACIGIDGNGSPWTQHFGSNGQVLVYCDTDPAGGSPTLHTFSEAGLDSPGYSVSGTPGFTGSGIFINFTIVGGIITSAS